MGDKILLFFVLQIIFVINFSVCVELKQHIKNGVVTTSYSENGNTFRVESRRQNKGEDECFYVSSSSRDFKANRTGWTTVLSWTNKDCPDNETAYHVGYNEGYIMAFDLPAYWSNTIVSFCKEEKELCNKVRQYVRENKKWLLQMINKHSNEDYWWQVNLVYQQVEGTAQGYAEHKLTTQPDIPVEDFWLMNMRGEIIDLVDKFSKSNDSSYTFEGLGSAIVKLLPNNKDLLVGHNSWFGYNTLSRVAKKYTLSHRLSKTSHTMIPGRNISFSSYPAVVNSIDDFYVTSAKLAVQETSIQNYNKRLWRFVKPKGTVPEFIRAMVANRLATSGKEWSDIFKKYNSGTYNNQWMIVDYKKFTQGKSPRRGLLWIVEQMPGQVVATDETTTLKKQSYWPSYNVPHNSKIYKQTHHDKMAAKYGSWFSYENSPRAQIIKRDHVNIKCTGTLMNFLRSNNYKHDSHSTCQCKPTHNAALAIAARYDLNLKKGSYPFAQLARYPGGATDAKLTNSTLIKEQSFIGVSGPTTGTDLPTFVWSKSDYRKTVPHNEQPDEWNFKPQLFTFSG